LLCRNQEELSMKFHPHALLLNRCIYLWIFSQ